jgi:hypothetical protein
MIEDDGIGVDVHDETDEEDCCGSRRDRATDTVLITVSCTKRDFRVKINVGGLKHGRHTAEVALRSPPAPHIPCST